MILKQKYCLKCPTCNSGYVLNLKQGIRKHSYKMQCRCGNEIIHTIPEEAVKTGNRTLYGFNPYDCRLLYRDLDGNDTQFKVTQNIYFNLDKNKVTFTKNENSFSVAFLRIKWNEHMQRLNFNIKPIQLSNRMYINSVDNFLPLYVFHQLEDKDFIGTQSGFQAIVRVLKPIHIQN